MKYEFCEADSLDMQADALAAQVRRILDEIAAYRWSKDLSWAGGSRKVEQRREELLVWAKALQVEARELAQQCEASIDKHHEAMRTEVFTFPMEPESDRLACLEIEAGQANRVEQALATVKITLNDLQCIIQISEEED